MHTLFLGFFICVLFPPFATQFFTAPLPTYLYYTTRLNLNCSGRSDTLYNNKTTYENDEDSTEASYCLIAIVTLLVKNLTQTITSRNAIYLWNMYRHIAINQCNFSTIMDIGYGSCTPYYYETATSIQLCICSTNYCSDTYTSCQASVNQALSSPPPLLPVLQPPLSNTITCQDFYVNYYATYNITPPVYLGCEGLISFGNPDFSKCSMYTPNHTVLCAVYYDSIQGSSEQMALVEGDYEILMYQMVYQGVVIAYNSSFGYQYQTSTSIAVISGNSGQSYGGLCLCATNNCNVDFTTCTSGMNIPSYLLGYNGSNSTTTSASSASGFNITTLQSSTAKSVTNSITTSGFSVENNNTLPSNLTSSSLSEKPFYSKLVVTILLAISLSLSL